MFDWERFFLVKVFLFFFFCFKIYYEVERSMDDVIRENSSVEKIFVLIIFMVMIFFVCFMLSKFCNFLIGYLLFVGVGVMVVVFGILVGMGVVLWC